MDLQKLLTPFHFRITRLFHPKVGKGLIVLTELDPLVKGRFIALIPSAVTPTAPCPAPRCWTSYHRWFMHTLLSFVLLMLG